MARSKSKSISHLHDECKSSRDLTNNETCLLTDINVWDFKFNNVSHCLESSTYLHIDHPIGLYDYTELQVQGNSQILYCTFPKNIMQLFLDSELGYVDKFYSIPDEGSEVELQDVERWKKVRHLFRPTPPIIGTSLLWQAWVFMGGSRIFK